MITGTEKRNIELSKDFRTTGIDEDEVGDVYKLDDDELPILALPNEQYICMYL